MFEKSLRIETIKCQHTFLEETKHHIIRNNNWHGYV